MIFANICLYVYLLVFIHPDCHYHHAGDHDAGVGMIVKHIKSSKIESYGGEEEKTQAVMVMVKQLSSCSLIEHLTLRKIL